MGFDLRQSILIVLGGVSLVLYLASLFSPMVQLARHDRPDDTRGSSESLLAERQFVLKWFEKAGKPSTMRFLLVVLPIVFLGYVGLLSSLNAEIDEASHALDREIMRHGRDFASDSEVDSLSDSVVGFVIFSPLLLTAWTLVNAWTCDGIRRSYAWAIESGQRRRFVAGILLMVIVMCCPATAALILLKFEVDSWLVGMLAVASPVWLLSTAYDGAGRCLACSLAMVPAGLTAPMLAMVVGVSVTAIRGARHGWLTLVSLLPNSRSLRLIAGHVTLLAGLAALSALPAEAWLLVVAGAILELLALPGLVRSVAGPTRATRWAEYLASRHDGTSMVLRRSFDVMASWPNLVLAVLVLAAMLMWVARHATDPMPLLPAPSQATGMPDLVWTSVLGLWLAASAFHVSLLVAEAATRFAPVMLADRQMRRRAWIGPVFLLVGGIVVHLIAFALFSGTRHG